VSKVGGSVQRVDVPTELAFHAVAGSFFTIDAVLGKDLAQPATNELFHCPVGHGYKVDIALVLGLDTLGEEFAQPRARFASDGLSGGNPDEIRRRFIAHQETTFPI